VTFKYVTW